VFRSPEETGRVNRRVDCRSDIYSLGATFYKLLTGDQKLFLSLLIYLGRLPFDCALNNTLDIIHYTVTRTPPTISSLNPDVPSDLENVITMMMAKNKEERVQVTARCSFCSYSLLSA
jgi:serine/threonine protein kinase